MKKLLLILTLMMGACYTANAQSGIDDLLTVLEKSMRKNKLEAFRACWTAEALREPTVKGGMSGLEMYTAAGRDRWTIKKTEDHIFEEDAEPEAIVVKCSVYAYKRKRKVEEVYLFLMYTAEGWRVDGASENAAEIYARQRSYLARKNASPDNR